MAGAQGKGLGGEGIRKETLPQPEETDWGKVGRTATEEVVQGRRGREGKGVRKKKGGGLKTTD